MDSAEEAAEAEPSPVSGRRQKLRRQRAPPRLQSEKSFSSPAPVVLRLPCPRWHSAGPRSVTIDRAPCDAVLWLRLYVCPKHGEKLSHFSGISSTSSRHRKIGRAHV